MNLASIPAKFALVWASTGVNTRSIPTASQISVQAGAASLTDGFPPLCLTPTGSGGIPPFGQDINGILQQVTGWLRWAQAGGPIIYDATYSGQISGYPKGAVLQASAQTGGFWYNTVDGNTTNPDTGGANWVNFFAPVFASPTFSGTATFGGPALFQSTVALQTGFSAPNSTGVDSSGNFTVNNVKNNNISFLNPAAALVTFENAFGTPMQLNYQGTTANISTLVVGQNTTNGQMIVFGYRGTIIGSVTNTASSVSYMTTSDYRLKTNTTVKIDGADALARINAIDVLRGHMKGEEDGPEISYVLAHQYQEHLPNAVAGEKDGEIDLGDVYVPAGTPVAYGVDEPAELPAAHTWVRSGWRAGEPVKGAFGRTKAGPRVATGDVMLSQDLVIQPSHPEPAAADLKPGTAWRKTHRQINPQMVDHSKAVPDLIAAVQELTRQLNALKKGKGGDSAAPA